MFGLYKIVLKKIHNLSVWHIVAFWVVGGAVLFVVSFFAEAQTRPQILVSWRAESYAPPAYAGKILPTAGSPIFVSFDVIDGGKLADLSKQTIYWYLNNDLIENRAGVQSVAINVPARAPSLMELRIELPAYRNSLLLKTISIPVVRPEAVIEAPYPGRRFTGTQLKMTGSPYFFNIKDVSNLSFAWNVNGQIPTSSESPRELIINLDPNMPPESTVNIALSAANAKNSSEAASGFLTLTKQ